MGDIEQDLRDFIAETMLFSSNGYPHSDEKSFLENGIVDSLNVMELAMFSEKSYGISIDDHEIIPDNFDSIRNLAAFVRRKVAEST